MVQLVPSQNIMLNSAKGGKGDAQAILICKYNENGEQHPTDLDVTFSSSLPVVSVAAARLHLFGLSQLPLVDSTVRHHGADRD